MSIWHCFMMKSKQTPKILYLFHRNLKWSVVCASNQRFSFVLQKAKYRKMKKGRLFYINLTNIVCLSWKAAFRTITLLVFEHKSLAMVGDMNMSQYKENSLVSISEFTKYYYWNQRISLTLKGERESHQNTHLQWCIEIMKNKWICC